MQSFKQFGPIIPILIGLNFGYDESSAFQLFLPPERAYIPKLWAKTVLIIRKNKANRQALAELFTLFCLGFTGFFLKLSVNQLSKLARLLFQPRQHMLPKTQEQGLAEPQCDCAHCCSSRSQ